MKKVFCLLLALSLLPLLGACGSTVPAETVPAATEPAKPVLNDPTQPPRDLSLTVFTGEVPPSAEVSAEALLQKEGTETVTFDTREEYGTMLHSLGYTEFILDYHIDMVQLEVYPKSLTYNDEAFRLELSAYCNPMIDMTTDPETVRQYDGWVLYGTKAGAAQNITDLRYEDYQEAYCMDFPDNWRYEKLRGLDICPAFMRNEVYGTDEQGNVIRWACHEIRYYPHTRNLYNLINVVEDMEIGCHSAPRMLMMWEDALVEAWSARGLPAFEIYPGYLDRQNRVVMGGDHIGLSNIYYSFEPDMTLEEWVRSPYNMDGWRFVNDALGGTMISPERNYAILVDRDANGNALTLDSCKTSYGTYVLIAVEYPEYTALLERYKATN